MTGRRGWHAVVRRWWWVALLVQVAVFVLAFSIGSWPVVWASVGGLFALLLAIVWVQAKEERS